MAFFVPNLGNRTSILPSRIRYTGIPVTTPLKYCLHLWKANVVSNHRYHNRQHYFHYHYQKLFHCHCHIYSRIVKIFSNDILTFFQLMTANIQRDAIQPEPIFIWSSDSSSAGSPAIEEPASMELLPLPTVNYPVYKIT